MREWVPLFRREMLDWLQRPTLYVLLIAYWLLSGLLAFNVLLEAHVVTLEPYFQIAPILLALFILAVTSGQFVHRSDELDLVRILPLHASTVVGVRFSMVLLMLITALLGGLMVPAAVQISDWGNFDFGQLLSANFGLFFLGAAFTAVGLAVSAYSSSQTAAFLTAFVVVFAFWIPQHLAPMAPETLQNILLQISFSMHMVYFARGILWLPDTAYFFTFVCLGLFLAANGFESWRYLRRLPLLSWKPLVALFLLVLFHVLALRFPLRMDLTSLKLYSLSKESVDVITQLAHDVRIVFFCSSRLPEQLRPAAQDIQTLLEEYRVRSPRVKTAVLHPDIDPQSAELAKTYGVGEMEFGRKSASSMELQRITFGLALVGEEGVQIIPDATHTRFLEYEITSRLKRMLTGRRKIVFTRDHGEFPEKTEDPRGGYNRLFSTISEFEFVQLKGEIPPDAAVLAVAGPIREFSDAAWEQVESFLRQGKPVLVLADGMMLRNNLVVRGVARQWVPNPALGKHLRKWGIELNDDMVLSFSAPQVSVSSGKIMTFPLMPMVDASRSLTIMPFTVSTVQMVSSNAGFSVVRILRTDAGAWRHVHAYEEDMNWPQTREKGAFPVGLFLKATPNGTFPKGTRLVVLGDSDLFRDYNFQTVNTHAIFFRQVIDFLLEDEQLAHLRMRGRGVQRLKTENTKNMTQVMALGLGIPVFMLLVLGAVVNGIRRQKRRKNQNAKD